MRRTKRSCILPLSYEKIKNQAKEIQLKNAEGRKLTVILREYRPGDEEGMIACIRDEYQDTYFRTNLYDPEYLRKEAISGHSLFLIAQTETGEIAGMMLLKKFAAEEICEIASQIFQKKYRGFGLAMPFFKYGMEILLKGEYSAAYCKPVLFHDTTQKLLYRLGMRATGFLLNSFDMEQIIHSYRNGRNTKHSMGIQVLAVNRREAGTVYIPDEHQSFCRSIYESLGVTYFMPEEGGWEKELPISFSDLSYVQDEVQSSMEIRVNCVGMDLPERIEKLHEKYPLRGRQTVNLFLNISEAGAVWAYDILKDMGYFFAGLKPLCGNQEYMVLHHAGKVEMWMEDYVLTEEFCQLKRYIERMKK